MLAGRGEKPTSDPESAAVRIGNFQRFDLDLISFTAAGGAKSPNETQDQLPRPGARVAAS
jgi:hypothetical protein